MPEAIRVMAVYDEPIIIEGLRSIIGRTESMVFVGAVASPDELFAALGATHCDVIIMDYLISDDDCGNPDGLYLLRQIRVSHPTVRSILYTSVNRDGLRESAIAMGADAVLCKRDPLDVLTKTIQVLASGSMRIAPASRVCADTAPLAAERNAAAVSVATVTSNWGEGRRAHQASPEAAEAARALPRTRDGPLSRMSAREPFGRCGQGAPLASPVRNRATGEALPLREWERGGEADAAASRWSEPSSSAEAAGASSDGAAAALTRRLAQPTLPSGYQAGASVGATSPALPFFSSPLPTLPYDALIRCPDVLANSASNGTRGVWLENRLSLTRLSPRETEIVRLLSNGRSLKEVAAYLGRSAKTISNQKRSAMLKLGLHSDIDLLRFAIEAGLT